MQQMPADGPDRVRHGQRGFRLADPSCEPPEPCRQVALADAAQAQFSVSRASPAMPVFTAIKSKSLWACAPTLPPRRCSVSAVAGPGNMCSFLLTCTRRGKLGD